MKLSLLIFLGSFAFAQTGVPLPVASCTDKPCVVQNLLAATGSGAREQMLRSLEDARIVLLKDKRYNPDPKTAEDKSQPNAALAVNWTQLNEPQKDYIRNHPLVNEKDPIDQTLQSLYQGVLKKVAILSILDPKLACGGKVLKLAEDAARVCSGALNQLCSLDTRVMTDLTNGGLSCYTSIIGPSVSEMLQTLSFYNTNAQNLSDKDPGNPFLRGPFNSVGKSSVGFIEPNSEKAKARRLEKFMGEIYTDAMEKATYNLASVRFKYGLSDKMSRYMNGFKKDLSKDKKAIRDEKKPNQKKKLQAKLSNLQEKLKGRLEDWLREDDKLKNLKSVCVDAENPNCKTIKDKNGNPTNTTEFQRKLNEQVIDKLSADIINEKIAPKNSDQVREDLCKLFTDPKNDLNYPFDWTPEYAEMQKEINSIETLGAGGLSAERPNRARFTNETKKRFGSYTTESIREALRNKTPNSDAMLLMTKDLSSVGESDHFARLNLKCKPNSTSSEKSHDTAIIGEGIKTANFSLISFITKMNTLTPGTSESTVTDRMTGLQNKLYEMIQAAPDSVGKSLLNHEVANGELVCDVLAKEEFKIKVDEALRAGVDAVTDGAGYALMASGFAEPEGLLVKSLGKYAANIFFEGVLTVAELDALHYQNQINEAMNKAKGLYVAPAGATDEAVNAAIHAQKRANETLDKLSVDAEALAFSAAGEFLSLLKNAKTIDEVQELEKAFDKKITEVKARPKYESAHVPYTEHEIEVEENAVRIVKNKLGTLRTDLEGLKKTGEDTSSVENRIKKFEGIIQEREERINFSRVANKNAAKNKVTANRTAPTSNYQSGVAAKETTVTTHSEPVVVTQQLKAPASDAKTVLDYTSPADAKPVATATTATKKAKLPGSDATFAADNNKQELRVELEAVDVKIPSSAKIEVLKPPLPSKTFTEFESPYKNVLYIPLKATLPESGATINLNGGVKMVAPQVLQKGELNSPIYKYEVDLAKQSGLEIEEILGVTRNFTKEQVLDGSTGVFVWKEGMEVNANFNLINAYKKGLAEIEPGKISIKNIIDLRNNALEIQVFNRGDNTIFHKTKWKSGSAKIKGDIPNDVLKKLNAYGIKYSKTLDGYTIFYPDVNPETQLQKYVADLNQLVKSHAPPEYIVSKAVQDFLIIHPFEGGNGRSARLLGQILYKKLTGKTILFPEVFFKEMNTPLEKLTSSLLKNFNTTVSTSRDNKSILEIEQVTTEYYKDSNGGLPRLAVVPSHAKAEYDVPFANYELNNRNYTQLSGAVKYTDDKPLFFGVTTKKPEANINLLFTYGRSTRGKPHYNIAKHVESTRGDTGPSGFMQTSKSYDTALEFTKDHGEGVVYVIDPKGADLLDVSKAGILGQNSKGNSIFSMEEEVLFYNHLNPCRIFGAYIVKSSSSSVMQQVDFVVNPNYKPQKAVTK